MERAGRPHSVAAQCLPADHPAVDVCAVYDVGFLGKRRAEKNGAAEDFLYLGRRLCRNYPDFDCPAALGTAGKR